MDSYPKARTDAVMPMLRGELGKDFARVIQSVLSRLKETVRATSVGLLDGSRAQLDELGAADEEGFWSVVNDLDCLKNGSTLELHRWKISRAALASEDGIERRCACGKHVFTAYGFGGRWLLALLTRASLQRAPDENPLIVTEPEWAIDTAIELLTELLGVCDGTAEEAAASGSGSGGGAGGSGGAAPLAELGIPLWWVRGPR